MTSPSGTIYSVRRRPRAVALVARAVALVGAFLTIFSALATVGIGAFVFMVGLGAH